MRIFDENSRWDTPKNTHFRNGDTPKKAPQKKAETQQIILPGKLPQKNQRPDAAGEHDPRSDISAEPTIRKDPPGKTANACGIGAEETTSDFRYVFTC